MATGRRRPSTQPQPGGSGPQEGYGQREPGNPNPGTGVPSPLGIYARPGHHIEFLSYTVFVPRGDPGLKMPTGLPDSQKFQTKNPAGACPSWGDLSISQAPL